MKKPSQPRRNSEPLSLEEEPHLNGRTDTQAVINDLLKRCSKDGLAWKRMENVENYFW